MYIPTRPVAQVKKQELQSARNVNFFEKGQKFEECF